MKIITIILFLICVPVSVAFGQEAESESGAEEEPETVASEKEITGEPTAEVEDAPERILLPERQLQLRQLARSLPERETSWLNESGGVLEEPESESTLALYLPPNAPRAQGAVILVHDLAQHPDWPEWIGPLRTFLPDAGWHTLSLAMPQGQVISQVPPRLLPPKGASPATEELPEEAEETESSKEEDTQPAENAADDNTAADSSENADNAEGAAGGGNESVDIDMSEEAGKQQEEGEAPAAAPDPVAVIGAGVRFMRAKGLVNQVLLGVGEGARQILNYLKESPGLSNPQATTLVLVNSDLTVGEFRDGMEALPSLTEMKVLDLYDPSDSRFKDTAAQRRKFANRNDWEMYHQVESYGMSFMGGFRSQRQLNRIKAWLGEYSPGRNNSDR